MTPKQYEVLKTAYDSLDVSLNSDDYTAIGKMLSIVKLSKVIVFQREKKALKDYLMPFCL